MGIKKLKLMELAECRINEQIRYSIFSLHTHDYKYKIKNFHFYRKKKLKIYYMKTFVL